MTIARQHEIHVLLTVKNLRSIFIKISNACAKRDNAFRHWLSIEMRHIIEVAVEIARCSSSAAHRV
jgi:hypothetical protein